MRIETRVGGTPVDFGVLSARSVVTGNDGIATLVYTAPPSPAVSPDPFLMVDIVVTPLGTDFNNSNQRSAAIRLVPQGPVSPPFNLVAGFEMTPQAPSRQSDGALRRLAEPRERSRSTAGTSAMALAVVGRTDDHAYAAAGTYIVTLTVVDSYGRTRVEVAVAHRDGRRQPTAAFIFSPTAPRVGQSVNFNAAQSRPAAGGTLTSYTWNFGDGTPSGHRRTDHQQGLRRRRHLSGDADRHGQRRSNGDESPYAVTITP